jgi:hypothetical protein
MRIVRDETTGTYTFVAVTDEEVELLCAIRTRIEPEDKIIYCGRRRDESVEGDRFCVILLNAGGREERRTRTTESGMQVNVPVYVGGVPFTLCGTTEHDKRCVGSIRNACYFGSAGLIYLSTHDVDERPAIVVTCMRCPHCNANMVDMTSCEWRTCNACAATCDHRYERGVVHNPKTDIDIGVFCQKCGRAKRDTEEVTEPALNTGD